MKVLIKIGFRVFYLLALCICGCNGSTVPKDDSDFIGDLTDYDVFTRSSPERTDFTSISLDNDHPAIQIMHERAKRISKISWTPKGEIPKSNGDYLPIKEYNGVLYSSVKELDKFVGQEVSFQTFISAVNNPRSVLYTEQVNKSPYKGVNCAAYYGTVCSMTTNYALGMNRPYRSSMYKNLPFIKKVTTQDFYSASAGDILIVEKDHMILITEVKKDQNGRVTSMELLESNSAGTSLKQYSISSIIKRFEDKSWELFRYINLAGLDDTIDSFMWDENKLSYHNGDLCLNRGNWVTYREGEEVVVNVLSSGYNEIVLIKDEEVEERRKYTGVPDVSFLGLSAGLYSVYLENGTHKSNYIEFEVINTEVGLKKKGDWLRIDLSSSNSIPEYIVFCDKVGSRSFVSDVKDDEISRGYKIVKCESSIDGLFIKVFFRGAFGRVSNSALKLK